MSCSNTLKHCTDSGRKILVKLINCNSMLHYNEGLKLQNNLISKVKQGQNDIASNNYRYISGGYLILLQHTPVYTVGIRDKEYDINLKNKLINTGAEFCKTNRGGLITFHGPGQLIAYPILNLKSFDNLTIKCYINRLEQTVLNMCKNYFNIIAERSPHTGVWIGNNKLCAIGIHGSSYVTSHGIAINCNTDLNWFKHIVPCGIQGKGVTSLTEHLKQTVTVEDTILYYINSFNDVFNCETSEIDEEYKEQNVISKL